MTPTTFIRWSASIIAVGVFGSAALCVILFVGSAVVSAVMQVIAGK